MLSPFFLLTLLTVTTIGGFGPNERNITPDQSEDPVSRHNITVQHQGGKSRPSRGSSPVDPAAILRGSTSMRSADDGSSEKGPDIGALWEKNSTSVLDNNESVWLSESNKSVGLTDTGDSGILTDDDTFTCTRFLDACSVMTLVSMPAFALPGCVCNVFNIFVLLKQGDVDSTTTFLVALSLADLLFLVTQLLLWGLSLLGGLATETFWALRHALRYRFLGRYLAIATGRFSNWLVVVLALERFFAVRFPLLVKTFPTSRHPRKIIISLCFYVFAILLPNMFAYQYAEVKDEADNTTAIALVETDLLREHRDFYRHYTMVLLVTLRLLPVLLVLLFNAGIFLTLTTSRKQLAAIHAADSKRQRKEAKVTRMLVAISVIFLLCVSPGLVHSMLHNFLPDYQENYTVLWHAIYQSFRVLDVVNSTVNFFIYIVVSERFREVFLSYFCRRRGKDDDFSDVSTADTNHT